jgi:hypothetical protein
MSDESPKKGDSKPSAPHENAAETENYKMESVTDRIVSAFEKINRANRKADAAENNRNHRREQRRFKVEILEISLIAIYAFVTVLEWGTFDSERKTMEKEFQTSITNAAAQYDIGRTQIEQNRLANQMDERAWVFVKLADNALNVSTNFGTFIVTMKNVGKTPALITSVFGNMAEAITDIPAHDPVGTKLNMMIIPENEGVTKNEGVTQITFPPTIESRILQNSKVYVFGTIYYSDIYGTRHWCQYCFSLSDHGNTMTQEISHNSCDDLEQAQKN